MSYLTPKKVVMILILLLALAACLPYDNGDALMTATVGTEPPDTATSTEILPSETKTATATQTATVDNATLPASATPTVTQLNTSTDLPSVETETVPPATTQAAPASTSTPAPTFTAYLPTIIVSSTNTPVPTATPTVVPPTNTPVPTSTAVPTAMPTATPTATATLVPTLPPVQSQAVAIVGDSIVFNSQFLPELPERPCAANGWRAADAAYCVNSGVTGLPAAAVVMVGVNDWLAISANAASDPLLLPAAVRAYEFNLSAVISYYTTRSIPVYVIGLPAYVPNEFVLAQRNMISAMGATEIPLPGDIPYIDAVHPDPVALSALVRPYISGFFLPEPTPTQIITRTPTTGGALLFNGSFEDDRYVVPPSGTSGLLPFGWTLYYTSGQLTYCDRPGNQGDCYYTFPPEIIPKSFGNLPEVDWVFVLDGNTSIKIFGGYKPIRAELVQEVYLDRGVYTLTFGVAPDNCNVDQFGRCDVGGKVYPGPDTWGADGPVQWYEISQVRALPEGAWFDARQVPYGQYSIITHTFLIEQAGDYEVGAELYGPVGVTNNGWFVDMFTLMPASARLYTVKPGDGWISITNKVCPGNDWQRVQDFSLHEGVLQPGQVLEIFCP